MRRKILSPKGWPHMYVFCWQTKSYIRASYISYVSGVFVSVFQWPQCSGAFFGI